MACYLRLLGPSLTLRTQFALAHASTHTRSLTPLTLQPLRLADAVTHGACSVRAGEGQSRKGAKGEAGTLQGQHARPNAAPLSNRRPPIRQRRHQHSTTHPQQQQTEGNPATAKKEKRPERVLDAAAVAALEAEYQQALRTACVSEGQRLQLERYLDYLLDTNKVMNLTGEFARN